MYEVLFDFLDWTGALAERVERGGGRADLCGGVCRLGGGRGQRRSLCRAFGTGTGLGDLRGGVWVPWRGKIYECVVI